MNTQKTLLKLMSLPTSRFEGVVLTADGCYIARAIGDVGYNVFLGKPKPPHDGPGRDMMLHTWRSLTREEKAAVLALAANPIDGQPIPLARDFGVPVGDLHG